MVKRKGVDHSQGARKKKRDVVQTPVALVPAENAPSSSGWHNNEFRVYDLNPTCNSNNPNLTIIFFHGITFGTNDEWKETWTTRPTDNREKCICWPEKWLPEDLNNNVRILSLSYDSNIVGSVHNDVTEIGKNLVQSLIANPSYQSLWDGPVALIAYSFGGLVLKSLVVEVRKHVYQMSKNDLDDEIQKCCKTFLNNFKGVVFYGVPHSGATENLSKYFNWKCQQINLFNKDFSQPSFSRNLKPFSQQMESLSKEFRDAVHEDLNIYEFSEGLPVDENLGILVPYVSATRLSNNNNYKIEDANHLTICKPLNKDHPSYYLLLRCLRICMQKNIELPPLPCHEVALINKAKDINILLQKESIVGLVGMGGIGKTTFLTGGDDNEELWNVLRISYDHLDEQHKNMFLDIACFLGGLKINTICRAWNGDYSSPKLGLQNLQDRSLIEQGEGGILYIHDQLRDMGQNIAMKLPFMNRFVWKSNQSNDFLQKDEVVVKHLKGISLKKCVNLPLLSQIDSKGFHNLRLVDLTEASQPIVENFIQRQNLNNVKWLCLKKCMMEKLSSNLFSCSQLRMLDLEECQNLKELPSFIDQLNALQELNLLGWNNLLIFQHINKHSSVQLQASPCRELSASSINHLKEEGSEVRYEEDSCQLAMISRQAGINVWSFYLLGSQNCVKNQERNMETEVGKRQMIVDTCYDSILQCMYMRADEKGRTIYILIMLHEMTEKWLPKDLNNNVRILSLSYDSNIVGSVHNDVTEIAKDINILLQKESIVGLVGMGGIGKTTLCRKFYHLFHNQYEKSSFLEDVNSKDNINDVIKQLLHDLCGERLCKDENVKKEHLDKITQCMISKKVLVVVDNVGTTECLTFLPIFIDKATKNPTFKSKVLVNCRNWQLLKSHVSEDGKVVMKSLKEEQARELFMFHAFHNANHVPTKEFNDTCMKIIKACGGLPLSLKVLGSFLCNNKELEIWEDALNTLKNGQSLMGGDDNEELWNVLRISYDHLDEQHKNMFLDIACFLGGLKINTICRAWNGDYSSPKLGLQNLQDRSLIEQGEGGILYIHDQLRDMGQNIAMKLPFMNRFVWKSNHSNDFLQKDEVVKHLKGISLKKCVNLPLLSQIDSKGFHNLRLVDLTEASQPIVENFIQRQNLNNVKWLCLKKCMMEKLSSNLFSCSQLRMLDLAECQNLKELPSFIDQLNALQELNLSGCFNLKELPSSIGQLNALQKLDLSCCSNLEGLPSSIGQLNALQELDLSYCSNLEGLPSSIGQLNALQELDLSYCSNLEGLPSSIGQLNALQKLFLWNCLNLEGLPSSIGQLNALQDLTLSRVFQVRSTTFIYWPIECTPTASFVGLFELGRTTFMYWPIECTPRA
ncbi:unnamed protein product [Sphagnum jensenii]|uniref:NB-ARC domain-containing protein n=1 Tax=Sphagnum jensenii TaxID=128206 RepID=A0ABP0XHI1_9BRYO